MTLILLVAQAHAFCGTFVGGDGALLTNSASQVVLAREGTRTTLTLAMDYQGDLSEFALLIPVPEVLDAADVTSPEGRLLTDIDTYSMPREVAYACSDVVSKEFRSLGCGGLLGGCSSPDGGMYMDSGELGESSADTVSVESAFSLAGYEFVVLSAEESAGLETWLDDNGYPDWAPAAWTLGLGGHAAGGIDFGKGKVRPRIGLESSMTLATTSYSADVLLPDGTLSWAWNPSRLRVAVVVGVAFGAPVSGPS